MAQSLAAVSLLVNDYDEAIEYYVGTLDFVLVEDSPQPGAPGKRFVRVMPKPTADNTHPSCLLLARAKNDAEKAAVGAQTGGRVFLFLHTDDFDGDYQRYRERGVDFIEAPRYEAYGSVVVFRDCYGNLWDLVQPANSSPAT